MENLETRLIDGCFSKIKAKTVLLELINNKINFHKVEKFSNEIRFGQDTDHSEKRIQALNIEKENLLAWIESVDNNAALRLNCVITTEIVG